MVRYVQGEPTTKIVVYRDIFIRSYTNDENARQLMDKVIDTKSFKQLLISVIGEKDRLLGLCKAKRS